VKEYFASFHLFNILLFIKTSKRDHISLR